jgi:hypothetical protein
MRNVKSQKKIQKIYVLQFGLHISTFFYFLVYFLLYAVVHHYSAYGYESLLVYGAVRTRNLVLYTHFVKGRS